MERSDDRVLIIGAGPGGLCLALKLAKEGVQKTREFLLRSSLINSVREAAQIP